MDAEIHELAGTIDVVRQVVLGTARIRDVARVADAGLDHAPCFADRVDAELEILDERQVLERAETLSFPQSVVDFMAGKLGQPYGGFPEPFRTHVLKNEPRMDGRPGATLPPRDFDHLAQELRDRHGPAIREQDVMSAALYPKVFEEYRAFRDQYADVSVIPTRFFLAAPEVGDEFNVEIEKGKTLVIKLTAVGALDKHGQRDVFFELNGQPRRVQVRDRSAQAEVEAREKADPSREGSVGAPMPGTVIDIRVAVGDEVAASDPLVVLSAMKMETVVASPVAGVVSRIAVEPDAQLSPGDLIVEIDEAPE
ncbi:MAG: biotin/lipoyl-containing protein [Polyangiaceae bacterium]